MARIKIEAFADLRRRHGDGAIRRRSDFRKAVRAMIRAAMADRKVSAFLCYRLCGAAHENCPLQALKPNRHKCAWNYDDGLFNDSRSHTPKPCHPSNSPA